MTTPTPTVMPGLDPGIHAVPPRTKLDCIGTRLARHPGSLPDRVDPRVKPWDDGMGVTPR